MKHFTQAIIYIALYSCSAYGYELATHGLVTQQAYTTFSREEPLLINHLGITENEDDLGGNYFDLSGNEIRERNVRTFERDIIENKLDFLSVSHQSITGWLMRGAIREDDAKGEDNPQDDPYNPNLKRTLHHFYDPDHDLPLTVTGLSAIDNDVHTAPAWALADVLHLLEDMAQLQQKEMALC